MNRLLVLALALSVSAANAAEPFALKNIKLGSTIEEVREIFPSDPNAPSDESMIGPIRMKVRGRLELQNFSVADALPQGLVMNFIEEPPGTWRLFEISVKLPVPTYSHVLDGLKQKYGTPASQKQSTAQNRMGATFANEITTWDNGVSSIRLERIGRKLDQSELQYKLTDLNAKAMQRYKDSKTNAAASDL